MRKIVGSPRRNRAERKRGRRSERPGATGAAKRWLRDNALGLVTFGAFLVFLAGQSIAGMHAHNEDQRRHGQPTAGWTEFVTSGDFGETVFENWESEFLQMGAFVLLTVWLRQKGSAESKKVDEHESVDDDPGTHERPDSPWPVRYGGLPRAIYSNSLAIAFGLLFAASFALHAITGASHYNDERTEHGQPPVSTLAYVQSSRFWYESFQNWQSEFLAVGAMVVLSVFLRQRGSKESKPVAAPHDETGD
jgi:hypothetical protein